MRSRSSTSLQTRILFRYGCSTNFHDSFLRPILIIQVLVDAIVNTGPREDSTRIGSQGTVRRQAVDVSPLRRVNQAISLLTIGVSPTPAQGHMCSFRRSSQTRESAFRNVKSVAECLADELINAAKGSSNSYAIKVCRTCLDHFFFTCDFAACRKKTSWSVSPNQIGKHAAGATVAAFPLDTSFFTPLSHLGLYMRVSICRSCARLMTTRVCSLGQKAMICSQMQQFEILA
jgi:ribosomal protein S7